MSVWPIATRAANRAVNAPTPQTTALATSDASNTTCIRFRSTTPEVTIVAAWMSAETGVGPAIASGSQKYRGNWADLPIAPTKSRSPMPVASAGFARRMPKSAGSIAS